LSPGVAAELVGEAVEYARTQGARSIEAFPLDSATTPSASGTG